MSFRLAVALASLSTLALPCAAQSGQPATMTPLANPDPRLAAFHAATADVRRIGGVALSPDGAEIAYVARTREGRKLHVLDAATADEAKEKIVNPGSGTDCSNTAPAWSPDSRTLAFTSDCTADGKKGEQAQIFLWTRATGETRQLSHLHGAFESVQWAPDGHSLGLLFVENASRSAGALAAMKPWSGVIGEDGVEVQRVVAVDAEKGELTFLTPPTLHAYEFDWSPKSDAVAFTAAPPPGENTWWIAKLYTAEVVHFKPESGAAHADATGTAARDPKLLLDLSTTPGELHGLQIAQPAWSPDGKRIAFIGGLMSDQGSTGGDIYTVPAAGGAAPANVSVDHTVSPSWIEWVSPSVIRTVAWKGGSNLVADWNVDTHKQAHDPRVVEGGVSAADGGVSSDRRGDYAFVSSTFDTPYEIYLQPASARELRQVTHLNAGIKPIWGHSESVEWSNDGFHVQGWLTYPVNYDAAKKYPVIVSVHGGPSAAIGSYWDSRVNVFSALGYFIFQPNPRGSYGQGEKFAAANFRDFGYGDLRDILTGLDTVEKKVSIDPRREGLTGWSYGGFMTMFGVTQTNRFRAAVAGAGISDWKSYYGENSIDQWMTPFFGASVYRDPAIYAKSSAIEFIDKVKTPTLVIVGDRDGECPAPQSFEFWHALRTEGVKTQLIVYPNEGHGFVNPDHIRDREARMAAWFAENMPAGDQPVRQASAARQPAH